MYYSYWFLIFGLEVVGNLKIILFYPFAIQIKKVRWNDLSLLHRKLVEIQDWKIALGFLSGGFLLKHQLPWLRLSPFPLKLTIISLLDLIRSNNKRVLYLNKLINNSYCLSNLILFLIFPMNSNFTSLHFCLTTTRVIFFTK